MAVNTKDKYYTPDWLVEYTIKKTIEIIGKENISEIVEPSAGDGAFIEPLKKAFPNLKQRYYDLYPEHPDVVKYNYKNVPLSYKKGRLTIGNPPFGVSSSLWKAFCKKAATNSDYIAFISPASQYNSNYYFKEGVLVYSELLNDVEYRGSWVENGKAQKVRTSLNIYKVYNRDEVEDWREEKIKSILKYGRTYKDENINYEYYLANMTSGKRFGEIVSKEEYAAIYGVTVLDESKRKQVEDILQNRFGEEIKKIREGTTGLFYINNANFIEVMKKLLYPTREERLEQDVEIRTIVKYSEKNGSHSDRQGIRELNWDEYEYFICKWGSDMGRLYKKPLAGNTIAVKILNENMRDKIENFLSTYKTNPKYNFTNISSGTPVIGLDMFKEHLIKHIYPIEECDEDFNYSEVSKPVKVERAYHAISLIEPTFIEEEIKEKKELKTKVLELF